MTNTFFKMVKYGITSLVVFIMGIVLATLKTYATEWTDSFTVTTGYSSGSWSTPYTFSFDLDDDVTYYISATYGYTWLSKEDYIKKCSRCSNRI